VVYPQRTLSGLRVASLEKIVEGGGGEGRKREREDELAFQSAAASHRCQTAVHGPIWQSKPRFVPQEREGGKKGGKKGGRKREFVSTKALHVPAFKRLSNRAELS